MTAGAKPDRQQLVASLMNPAAYPDIFTGPVERISTHISDVFLAGEFAYKVKKPVNFGFCDFSTPELRYALSVREKELNQRLSNGVYLSVEPVNLDRATGNFSIDGEGEQVDWALKMRRLRSGDQLDAFLAHGEAGVGEIRQIAALLAEFHREAAPAPDEYGTVEAVAAIVLGNLDRVAEHAQPELDQAAFASISAYANEFVRQRGKLIRQRHEAGKPRMCHGDLHAGNIFLERQSEGQWSFQIIDCIEFNDSFVYVDPAADIAFLSMDLKRLDRPDLAEQLIKTYIASSEDSEIEVLLPFYESYRAMVRCMAASIMAEQSEAPDRQRHVENANAYLQLATDIVAADRPQFLAITAGVTGTGKSTVAGLVAQQWGAVHLQTDAIRRELAGIGPTERSGSDLQGGIYTQEMSHRTYEEMHRRATAALTEGKSVIMDGTHLQREFRKDSLDLGRKAGAMTILIECSLDESEAVVRLETRYASGQSESEGRPEVHARQVRDWEPPLNDESDAVVRVDTGGPASELPREVFGELWQAVL